jgi:hypothetical protein
MTRLAVIRIRNQVTTRCPLHMDTASIQPSSQPRHSEYPWCSGQGCLMVMRSHVSTANTESTCLTCAQHAAVFGYKTEAAIHAWKHVLDNIHCMWEQGGVYQAENQQLLTVTCDA